MRMGSMPMGSASEGPAYASISAGRPSQQISIKNGRPLAGMNPGGMSIRNAKATSTMLAVSVRLLRLPEFKRVSRGVFLARKSYHGSQSNSCGRGTPDSGECE
jgi:hypothetical protein